MLHQIKSIMKHHKAFTILLSVAQFLGILILFFSAATIQSVSVKQKELETNALDFRVRTVKNSDELEEKAVGFEIKDGEKIPVRYEMVPKSDYSSCISFKEVTERLNSILDQSQIKQSPEYIWVSGIYNDKKLLTYPLGDNNIKKGEIKLNELYYSEYKEGDEFQLGDKTLKVAKVGDFWADMIVAPSDVPDEWSSREIYLTYKTAPTTSEAEEMQKLLIKSFDCDDIMLPDTIDPLTAQFNSMAVVCSFLMLIAVLLNICYAQLYRFRLAKRSFAVFRLVGGKVSTICLLCYSEMLLVSLCLYTTATAVFHYLLKGTIISWYEGVDSLYTKKYYLLFGIAYLVFQVILISLPLKKFISKEIVLAEKEAE